jgi:hypothetical protein
LVNFVPIAPVYIDYNFNGGFRIFVIVEGLEIYVLIIFGLNSASIQNCIGFDDFAV